MDKEVLKEKKNLSLKTIKVLWNLYKNDPGASDEKYGNLDDFWYDFYYVMSSKNQNQSYFVCKIDWKEGFRFYTNDNGLRISPSKLNITSVEYRVDIRGDTFSELLSGDELELLMEIWRYFAKEGDAIDGWKNCENIY